MSFQLPDLVLPKKTAMPVVHLSPPKPHNYLTYLYFGIVLFGFLFLLQRTVFYGAVNVVQGNGISVTGSVHNPVVSNNGVISLVAGSGITLTGDSHNPTITSSSSLPLDYQYLGDNITLTVANPVSTSWAFTFPPASGNYVMSFSGYVLPLVIPTEATSDYINIFQIAGPAGVTIPCGALFLKSQFVNPAFFSYSAILIVTDSFAGAAGILYAELNNGTTSWNVNMNGLGGNDFGKIFFMRI